MNSFEIIIPKMGESINEVTLIKLLKGVGDFVNKDDVIAEIATDKVDTELTSKYEGFITEIFHKEGAVIQVGSVLALISTDKNFKAINTQELINQEMNSEKKTEIQINFQKKSNSNNSDFFQNLSPLVKQIAKQENLTLEELKLINPSSKNFKLNKNDVIDYIKDRRKTNVNISSSEIKEIDKESVFLNESSQVIDMDRMRRLISDHMINSIKTSAHVTSFIEVKMGKIVRWREKNKTIFEQKFGEKLTYTHIILELLAKIIPEFPKINASVEDYKIYLHKNINIGVATALPTGNLIVPVVKKIEQKSLLGIVKETNKLTSNARNNKLDPDDIQGGTFTFTNLGNFGSLTGTPIINQPQLAILSAGVIQKKPVVIETEHGDTIGIDYIMIMSLSYDHRVIDGAMGGMFLQRLSFLIENFDTNRSV